MKTNKTKHMTQKKKDKQLNCEHKSTCLDYPFSLFTSLMSFDIFQYQISDAGLYQILMDPSWEKLHLTLDGIISTK
jgi:hypothetical protein